jgi:hypothetical protein
MRLYGKKFVKRAMQAAISPRIESRDAVITQIDLNQEIVYVRIQGSTKTIGVRWPRNWESQPSWMKVGNAVRVQHTGGNRGSIEIVGHGLYIPDFVKVNTPYSPDAIMCGFDLTVVQETDTFSSNWSSHFVSCNNENMFAYNLDAQKLVCIDARGAIIKWTLLIPASDLGAIFVDKENSEYVYVVTNAVSGGAVFNTLYRINIATQVIVSTTIFQLNGLVKSGVADATYAFLATNSGVLYKITLSSMTISGQVGYVGFTSCDLYPGTGKVWTYGASSGFKVDISAMTVASFYPKLEDSEVSESIDCSSEGIAVLAAKADGGCYSHDAWVPYCGYFWEYAADFDIMGCRAAPTNDHYVGPVDNMWYDPYINIIIYTGWYYNLGLHRKLGVFLPGESGT